jgi:hypothetical protein
VRRALLLLGLLGACSKDPAPAPAAAAKDAAATAPTADASGAYSYKPSGDKPANARRPTALPGMLDQALAVGATAPDIDLPATGGQRFRLADALGEKERVLLVFYRGDW